MDIWVCFHILAIVKLQWTWGCRNLFELLFSFPLIKYLQAELVNHIVVIFLALWGAKGVVTPSDFTKLHSFQQHRRVFPFLYILTNIFYPLLFNNSHSEKCDMISRGDFWLVLPWLVMQRIFHVSVGHLYIFGHMYSDPQKINTKMAE